MKGSRKWFLSLLLAATMVLVMTPLTALAGDETVGDFVVTTDNPSGYTYDPDGGALLFTQPGSYRVSMKSGVTTTSGKIQVNGGTSSEPIVVLLNNVSIQNGYCAFDVKNTSFARLVLLDGTFNSLTSGANYPGIRCLPGATVIIGGPGALNVQGGASGAGIGGDSVSNYNSGNISIAGGTVVATGGRAGAGIGGGLGGTAGVITISGGTVRAAGGGVGAEGAAGIGGGGYRGGGGTVYISGGSVKATGAGGAQDIGYGSGGSVSGTLMNKPAAQGGVNVYLTTITLESVSAVTAVTSLTASSNSAPYTYGVTDTFTDAQGKLYLYLPENASTTAAQTSDGATPPTFTTYTGSIQTTSDHLAGGTLSLPTRLAAPTGLAWDGVTPGKATWSAVANASSYTVQLYKDDAAQGGAVTGVTGTEYDFTSVIISAGTGDYTFKVTAVGDGASYTDSYPSAESAAYSYTAPVVSADISPDDDSFDKNPAGQADVTTTITWNDATRVTDVKAGGATIGAGNYTVSGDTLTIEKEYLAAQPIGSLQLTVEFDQGAPATLTITISDTTPPVVAVTNITVTAAGGVSSLQVGNTLQMLADVLPADATDRSVTWSIASGSGASIDSSGLVRATAVGSVIVRATANDGSGVYGEKVVTVIAKTGGGSGSTASTPTYVATVSGAGISGTTLPVGVDTDDGGASTDLGTLAEVIFAGAATAVLTMPDVPGLSSYTVTLPASFLSGSQGKGALTFSTGAGSVTIPSGMLAGIPETEGKEAGITIGQGDKSGLPDEVRTAIGDRPVVELTLTLGDARVEWNNPDAPVTVSIPYSPTAAELANPESIVVWYIDGRGKAVSVPNGRYDPATGTVTFTTDHFSYYAVVFRPVSFKDVAKDAWYEKAVCFIAAREITTGTGGGDFSPEAKLTRGQFIVMLMKAYGIAPDADPQDNFADAGRTYYTGYLAAAKRLGISAGVGSNLFAPEKEITRQEMFTLLYNALRAVGKLPQGSSGNTLSSFSDAGDIAPWAEEAMKLLVETGTIAGSGNRLSPKDTATRAQMAQMLYNLLTK